MIAAKTYLPNFGAHCSEPLRRSFADAHIGRHRSPVEALSWQRFNFDGIRHDAGTADPLSFSPVVPNPCADPFYNWLLAASGWRLDELYSGEYEGLTDYIIAGGKKYLQITVNTEPSTCPADQCDRFE